MTSPQLTQAAASKRTEADVRALRGLADIKRRICPGVVIECVENTKRPELNGTRRTVSKAQTKGFFWTSEQNSGRCWTGYPPAKDVQIVDADTFRFKLHGTEYAVTLRFAP